jgi:hypothetical protein
MVDSSGEARLDTNFALHGVHMTGIVGNGVGGTNINTDGVGAGNALCAECHFRTHGTTDAVDGQPETTRLVNFSPNVQPFRGVLQWPGTRNPAGPTCTLTCHGKQHDAFSYVEGE